MRARVLCAYFVLLSIDIALCVERHTNKLCAKKREKRKKENNRITIYMEEQINNIDEQQEKYDGSSIQVLEGLEAVHW